MSNDTDPKRRHSILALSLVGLVAGMVGLSFASVPLYRMFCQVTGYGGTPQRAEKAPGEVLDRTISIRFDGNVCCAGLPIVRYRSDARLNEIIKLHEDNGCPIFNPHRYTLEEGGMKQTDEVQLAFKREADPKGLLNPGKMIAWENPDFDWKTNKTYLFPGLQQAAE